MNEGVFLDRLFENETTWYSRLNIDEKFETPNWLEEDE